MVGIDAVRYEFQLAARNAHGRLEPPVKVFRNCDEFLRAKRQSATSQNTTPIGPIGIGHIAAVLAMDDNRSEC